MPFWQNHLPYDPIESYMSASAKQLKILVGSYSGVFLEDILKLFHKDHKQKDTDKSKWSQGASILVGLNY